MALLNDVLTYWQGNSTLTAAIPYASVWTGLVPEKQAFPFAVVTIISQAPNYVTRFATNGYIETLSFQISIFDTDPDNSLAVANTVVAQFQGQSISAGCMAVYVVNGPVGPVPDTSTPKQVYQTWVQFDYISNV